MVLLVFTVSQFHSTAVVYANHGLCTEAFLNTVVFSKPKMLLLVRRYILLVTVLIVSIIFDSKLPHFINSPWKRQDDSQGYDSKAHNLKSVCRLIDTQCNREKVALFCPNVDLPAKLHKYYVQRHRLFLKYDEGIQLDQGKYVWIMFLYRWSTNINTTLFWGLDPPPPFHAPFIYQDPRNEDL